ncbi:MAG: PAS domain S-box protein, partial [Acidobacteriota bacterium]
GRIVDVNETACRTLGYTREEMLGLTIFELDPPMTPGLWRELWSLLKAERRRIDEGIHRTKDGRTFPVEVTVNYLEYEGRELACVYARDITERKRSEAALKEEVIRRRTLMNQSRDGLVILDQTGKVYEANRAFAEMLGYSMEEMAQLYVWDWEAVMPREELKEAIRLISDAGDQFVTLHRRKDGSVYHAEVTSNAAVWEGQKLILCVCRDISERLKAEEALRESERRYRMVADYNYDWEYWAGTDGRMIYVSPSCERITGYSAEEFIHDPDLVLSIIHPEDRERVFPHLAQSNDCGSFEVCQDDFRIVTKGGEVRWISHTCQPVGSEDKTCLGRRASNRDITDRVKTMEEKAKVEAQLRQAQKLEAIGTLAGGIAHDFNNILSPIIGYTEMALYDIPPSSHSRHDLTQVLAAANRAKELVKQILSFSRLGEDQLMSPVDLSVIVKEAMKLLRASLPSSIEIRQNIQKITAVANPTQIHQVLMNLCTNAAQAMEEKGILDVSLTGLSLSAQELSMLTLHTLAPGSFARLRVSDTGHGMSTATLLRIFDPYFTTKAVGKGTGLGLAVVHGIVQRHGGEIRVWSELGQGTTFDVYLPLAEQSLQPDSDASLSPLQGTERILFVDDEPMIAEIGARMLKRLGYRVTAMSDPEEALSLFTADPQGFDLIVTDYTMPQLTGTELAVEMMKIRPDISVILCTGYSERVTPEMALQMGIRGFVMKPVERNVLARLVRAVLDDSSPSPHDGG